jgi:trans-resveratrol di-O-methyltransferase
MEIWNLGCSYVRSMALQCAVNLEIPNAIHRCGGSASLPDLLAVVPVPEHRKPYIPRLMRFLAAIGIVALDVPPPVDDGDANVEATAEAAGTGGVYRLTPVSSLLVDDVLVNGCTSLAPFVLMQTAKYHVSGFMHLSEWFKGEDGPPELAAETPFKMAHGTDLWGAMHRDSQFNEVFNAAMVSDSRLMLDFVVSRCGEVFDGIASLVDVGGGAGGAARAIAEAFPQVKCSVLDLPTVISSIQPVDSTVEYIAGDMMDSIPPTDAVLLKVFIHSLLF